MFGNSIREQNAKMLNFFEVKHAELLIEDASAIPFIIAAHVEAAIKQLIQTNKEYLLDLLKEA